MSQNKNDQNGFSTNSFRVKRTVLFQTSPRPVKWLKFCMFFWPFAIISAFASTDGFQAYFDIFSVIANSIPAKMIPYYLTIAFFDLFRTLIMIVATIGLWQLSKTGFIAIRILWISFPAAAIIANYYAWQENISIMVIAFLYVIPAVLQLIYFEKRRYLFDSEVPYPAVIDGKLETDPSVKQCINYNIISMLFLMAFAFLFNMVLEYELFLMLNVILGMFAVILIIWILKRKWKVFEFHWNIQKIWNVASVVLVFGLAVTSATFYFQSTSAVTEKEIALQQNNTLSEKILDLEDQLHYFGTKSYFLDTSIAFVTTNGTKYHRCECYFIEGKRYYAYNIELAESMGYEPCSVCWNIAPKTPVIVEDEMTYEDIMENRK